MKGNPLAPREPPWIADVASVVLGPGMPIDAALKALKRKIERAGIFRELKSREAFTPPGARRRLKSQRARTPAARAAAKRARALTPLSEANDETEVMTR